MELNFILEGKRPQAPPPPPVRQWGAPSGNVCVVTSVASFLVLGGGGKTPKCTDKMYIIILRERAKRASASETYIFRTQIHLPTYTINAFSFTYGMAL